MSQVLQVLPDVDYVTSTAALLELTELAAIYWPRVKVLNPARSVLGFETDEVLEEARRDLVYPKRINPLTTGTGLPRYIDGSRTLKSSGMPWRARGCGDGAAHLGAQALGAVLVAHELKALLEQFL